MIMAPLPIRAIHCFFMIMPPDVDALWQRSRRGGGVPFLPFEARIRGHHEGKMKRGGNDSGSP
jgi:hypothetical protein